MNRLSRLLVLTAASVIVAGISSPGEASARTLCGKKIASAKWAFNSAGPGWTLHIKPTSCGLNTARFFPRNAYNEAIRAGGGWQPNPGSLYEQCRCHAYFVALRVPGKSWNLDSWRPQVNWAQEIKDGCNPAKNTTAETGDGTPLVGDPTPAQQPPGQPAPGQQPPGQPASQPVFNVMNTSETAPDGVWFRNSPHTGDTDRITGLGIYAGEQVQLLCYGTGDVVGPYNDSLWYRVNNVSRPTVAGRSNTGWLNAHYIDDGKLANQIDAGVVAC